MDQELERSADAPIRRQVGKLSLKARQTEGTVEVGSAHSSGVFQGRCRLIF